MPKSRILVVEDEILVREDIEDCLAGLGHEVVSVASTGAEALRTIPTARPDLVLMDIRLKGDMDGIEAARQIRTNFRLPVIFLTAHADDSTLERAKAADPLGYIVKPFAETTVNAVIQTAMHKHALDRRLKESEEWLTMTLGSIGERRSGHGRVTADHVYEPRRGGPDGVERRRGSRQGSRHGVPAQRRSHPRADPEPGGDYPPGRQGH